MKMTSAENVEFKKSYLAIFSINYLFQGMNQSLFAVIVPIYIIIMLSAVGQVVAGSDIAFIASIVLLPWAIKLFFGMISDKYGSKKLGRRRPYILSSVIFAGILWMILPFMINPSNIILMITLFGVLINLGVAIADTAVDGLIIDICPKEQLGRTQGLTWGLRSVGAIAGGPVLAIFIVTAHLSVELLFIIFGILMIFAALTILFVKEADTPPKVDLLKNLKIMFKFKQPKDAPKRSNNWNVYFYSMFNAVIDGVAMLFLSLYVLIRVGIIEAEGADLSLLEESTDLNIYMHQANIVLLVSIGIIIGAIVGGRIADLYSRKKAVYLSFLVTTLALLLIILPVPWQILLFFASLIGLGLGLRHGGYSAVIGEYAKQYPDADSTYYSICNSFFNIGTIIGLTITGIIFDLTESYIIVFIFLALISNLGLLNFLMLKAEDYEYKLRESV